MRRSLAVGVSAWAGLAAALLAVQLSGLDLALPRGWFETETMRFAGDQWLWVRVSYLAAPWLGWTMLTASALALLLPQLRRRPAWRRAAVASWCVALVANGLLIEWVLKDGWGRPRPRAIVQFGGSHAYTPFWRPSEACTRNCSLASGHAAAGFALMAPGALARRKKWHRALTIGLLAGSLVGLGRVAQGAHFPTDVLVAGLVVLGCCLVLRWLWWHACLLQRRRAGRTQVPVPGDCSASG